MVKRKALSSKVGAKNQAQAAQKKKKLLADHGAFEWSAGKSGSAGDVIASDSESDEDDGDEAVDGEGAVDGSTDGDDEDEQETAQEKRMRLAKEYLGKITEQAMDDNDGDEDGALVDERIGARLHQDALEAMGKLFKQVASEFEEFEFDTDSARFLKGHRLPVTSVCLSEDGKTAFSSSKDGVILKWDLPTLSKTNLVLPKDDVSKATKDHEKCVLALALSSDGKFLASGGRDKLLRVWDADQGTVVETFQGHRDAVSALAFRQRSHALFSGSFDRSIKHWNLTEMGYVETLFGHQSEVHALDALYKERVVSSGRDRSVRFWKITEETQLVFYGNSGSMDCVKMVNDEYYVTGGDDGSLSLWFNGRKKPVYVVRDAHGAGNWISSLAVMPRTDLVASGSCDGKIRLWRADLSARTLSQVAVIPQQGYVNAMSFDYKGRFLLAGVGQEHRLGRWQRLKSAKNGLALIALPNVGVKDEDEEEDSSSSEDEQEEEATGDQDEDDDEEDEEE
jgi:ribosomal RNA-processing protein 9